MGENWNAAQLWWIFSVNGLGIQCDFFPFVFTQIDSANVLSMGYTILRLLNLKPHAILFLYISLFNFLTTFQSKVLTLPGTHSPLQCTFWCREVCGIIFFFFFFCLETLVYVEGYLISAPSLEYCYSNLYFNFSPAVLLAEAQMGSRAVGNQNWKLSWKTSEALPTAELFWEF